MTEGVVGRPSSDGVERGPVWLYRVPHVWEDPEEPTSWEDVWLRPKGEPGPLLWLTVSTDDPEDPDVPEATASFKVDAGAGTAFVIGPAEDGEVIVDERFTLRQLLAVAASWLRVVHLGRAPVVYIEEGTEEDFADHPHALHIEHASTIAAGVLDGSVPTEEVGEAEDGTLIRAVPGIVEELAGEAARGSRRLRPEDEGDEEEVVTVEDLVGAELVEVRDLIEARREGSHDYHRGEVALFFRLPDGEHAVLVAGAEPGPSLYWQVGRDLDDVREGDEERIRKIRDRWRRSGVDVPEEET